MAQWRINFKDLEFGARIGKGNFGEVYRGTYLGTDVAIKKLFFVDDNFMQKYIEREMDTLTHVNHPNIVQLIGLCIGMDDMFIITEFVEGHDLRAILKDKSTNMDWTLRVSILRDVSLAMNYLHAKGIIHRDLKSHNLLVAQADWKVKVCDFGLARTAPDSGQITMVGTNEWMAPEVQMGEAYSFPADVFSFGMVICELITRDKPPERKLKDCYAFKQEDVIAMVPPDTPLKLWELMCDCAETNPEDRPEFPEVVERLKEIFELLERAGGAIEGRGTIKPPPNASERRSSPPKEPAAKDDGNKKASAPAPAPAPAAPGKKRCILF